MKSTTLNREPAAEEPAWPIRLFNKSVLKQRKWKEISALLGSTEGMRCLDVGADNGVISYLLRQGGGSWVSADLDEGSVRSIKELVGSEVYQLDGGRTPFETDAFDRVVIVDFLEHIPDDQAFMDELHRILKPGGELIVNVPHTKESWLRRFRTAIGQTDEKHGHLRPGYTMEGLRSLFGSHFTLEHCSTYSKFFSEVIDTLIVFAVSQFKRGRGHESKKGMIVTGQDLSANRSSFQLYSLVYPAVWMFSQLDRALVSTSGYMLIAKARSNKGRVNL